MAAERLQLLLAEAESVAASRAASFPTPAYERYRRQAARYRDWGFETRHAAGDAYPLYTLSTLRNMANHLFDWSDSSDEADLSKRGERIRPCDIIFTSFSPSRFQLLVERYVNCSYLLISERGDNSLNLDEQTARLLLSSRLEAWWATNNEVAMASLDTESKLQPLPLGPEDALEIGIKNQPRSVSFHANVTAYINALRRAAKQDGRKWISAGWLGSTHRERQGLRRTLEQLGPSSNSAISIDASTWDHLPFRGGVRRYLEELGRYHFVLAPRGNGIDTHRLWEALLVGTIPIVKANGLMALYERLPVLVVQSWKDLNASRVRSFYETVRARREFYAYERLFADYWIGRLLARRERCLANVRARASVRFVYDYSAKGGWVELDASSKRLPAPRFRADGLVGAGGPAMIKRQRQRAARYRG